MKMLNPKLPWDFLLMWLNPSHSAMRFQRYIARCLQTDRPVVILEDSAGAGVVKVSLRYMGAIKLTTDGISCLNSVWGRVSSCIRYASLPPTVLRSTHQTRHPFAAQLATNVRSDFTASNFHDHRLYHRKYKHHPTTSSFSDPQPFHKPSHLQCLRYKSVIRWSSTSDLLPERG